MPRHANIPARTYNAGIGSAVPPSMPLPGMPMSAVELLTYFPHHCKWPDIFFRLYRAGWTYRDMAKLALYTREQLTVGEYKRRHQAIRHQARVAGKEKFGKSFMGPTTKEFKNHPDLAPVTMDDYEDILDHYDTSYVQPFGHGKIKSEEITLQRLCEGVEHHPEGENRGLLTQAIEYAQSTEWRKSDGTPYTTNDLEDIIETQEFALPARAGTSQWDQTGLLATRRLEDPRS